MDDLEGYCDGLAGAGMQDRLGGDYFDDRPTPDDVHWYCDGHARGALDRKAMLRNRQLAFARWAYGLEDD